MAIAGTPLRTNLLFALLPLLSLAIPAQSQNSVISITIDAILSSSSELSTYRDISIDWKMKGRAQALFNEGLNNLTEDNPALALKNFNAAISEDNTFWEVYYYRGVANRKLEKFADAKKDYKLLIDGDKERYFSNIELGKVALLEHDFDESDRYFNKAIKSTDDNAYAHYLKANNHLSRGQDKAASNAYRDCLKQDSSMHDAMVRLALLSSRKNLYQAFPYLNKVLRRDSLNANALLLRGLIRSSDNKALAIRDFNNLLIRNPDLLIGRYLRGITYCDLGDFDRAFVDFHRVVLATASDDNVYKGDQTWVDKQIDIQNLGAYTVSRVYGLSDTDGTALKKAFCLIASSQYRECIKVIDGLSIADTEPLCVYFKAICMEHSDQHKKAFELYCKALVLDKDIVDAYKKRGIYYQELLMWDKSINDFTTVLKLRPQTLIAIKGRGVSYYKTNRMELAVADFDRYLKIDSTNLEVWASRGMAYMKQNDVLRGSVDLVKAGRLDAIDVEKLSHSIDSILMKDDTLKVMVVLNKITKLAPWCTMLYAQKMRLLVADGKWDEVDREINYALDNKPADATKASYSYLLTVKAMSKSHAKKYDEAIVILSEAIDVDKRNALAFLERGKIHASSGRASKAMSDLSKAMALGQKDAGQLLASIQKQH